MELNEIEKDVEQEILLTMAKFDMNEEELLSFLFTKMFTVRHKDLDEDRSLRETIAKANAIEIG